MAIDLLNRLTQAQMNTTISKKTAEPSDSSLANRLIGLKNTDSVTAARILKTVLSLRPGDTLQGELVSTNGKDISLLLGDSVLLNAKMEKELMLTPGQKMSFTVSSNHNGKLSLKPLFANTGMEQNAMKALEAANIPVTDKTLALAEEMMRQGMPVNKQNLTAAYRQMGMYPDAQISDLVMLQKMDIPVTQESLSMMNLYQTNQHYLFSDLQSLSAQTADFLSEMVQSQPMDADQSFIKGFLDIFKGSVDMAQNGEQTVADSAPNASVSTEGFFYDTKAQSGETVIHGRKTIITENTVETTVANSLSPEETEAASKEAELLRLLKGDGAKAEGAKDAITQNLFDLLKDQFLMKPENMQSAEYVKAFYERLHEQVDKLQELIKSAGKESSALGKEVSTIKSNIQFMNQINEMYHYVQLPLKMNEDGANGDLYVYKRKHAKTGDDGKLTALLHLSMPTLGNMDVFLTLEDQKLSTRFCMEKEEMIDFIEQHIDRLKERLVKRGYNVTTTVTASRKEEEKTVIDEIMTTESAIPIMTSQSFDARC